jgi:hypothetical protein
VSENKMIKSIVVSSLFVLLLVHLCQIGFAAECSVSITPQIIEASHGDIITVDIAVDPMGSEIYGAQYGLHFDKNLLKAIDQTKGSFLSHDGTGTIEVSNTINNSMSKIEYGETRTGDPEVVGSVTNPDVLGSATFEVIGSGTSDLELEVLSNSKAEPIDAVVNSGLCSIGGAASAKGNKLVGFGGVYMVIGLIAALLMVNRELK